MRTYRAFILSQIAMLLVLCGGIFAHEANAADYPGSITGVSACDANGARTVTWTVTIPSHTGDATADVDMDSLMPESAGVMEADANMGLALPPGYQRKVVEDYNSGLSGDASISYLVGWSDETRDTISGTLTGLVDCPNAEPDQHVFDSVTFPTEPAVVAHSAPVVVPPAVAPLPSAFRTALRFVLAVLDTIW